MPARLGGTTIIQDDLTFPANVSSLTKEINANYSREKKKVDRIHPSAL